MNKFRTNFIPLLLAILLISSSLAYADTKKSSADYLCDYGIRLYNEGDIDTAIQEFSKALLLQPNNQLAKDYLARMGVDDGIFTGTRTTLSAVGDLSRHLADSRETITALQEKNEQMRPALERVNSEKERLRAAVVQKEDALRNSHGRIVQLKSDLLDQQVQAEKQLNELGEDLTDKQGDLDQEKELSHRQLKDLSLEQLANYKKESELDDLKRGLKETKDRARQEWHSHQLQVQDLHSKLDNRDQQSDYLMETIDTLKEEIKPKPEDAKTLAAEDRLLEYIQKFSESEENLCKSRSCYESQISKLEDEVRQLKMTSIETAHDKATKLDSLENDLIDTKDKVNSLSNQLLSKQFQPGERDELMAKRNELLKMEDTLAEKENQLEEQKNQLTDQQKDLAKLKKQLAEAQGKSASPEKLSELKKQLVQRESQIFERDVVIKARSNDITKLKEQIADMEERLNLNQRIIQQKEEQIRSLIEKMQNP